MSEDPYAIERAESHRRHQQRWDAAAHDLGLDPATTRIDEQSAIRQEYIRRWPLWSTP
jgi:hypothetical protein